MDNYSLLNTLLDALATRYGIAGLRLNDAGMAALRLADDTELTFEYVAARDKLFVYVPLREVPEHPPQRAAMLACALQMNCMESGVTDAVVALDRYGETLLLQTGMSITDLDIDRLDRTIHSFLAQIGDINRRLDASADTRSTAGKPAARSTISASLRLLTGHPTRRST